MEPFTTLLTFMVMALTLISCTAAPQAKPTHEASSNVGNLIDITFPNTIEDSSSTNSTADINTQNKCYDWDSSEKWKDVGGQHSEFVNQAVYNLCQLIAIDAYKGFSSGNTVSSILLQHLKIYIKNHVVLTATYRLSTARRSPPEAMERITTAASAYLSGTWARS